MASVNDGTIWLLTTNEKIRFATNTTKESPQRLRTKLNELGFDVQDHEVRGWRYY
jgi:hypothetical protein